MALRRWLLGDGADDGSNLSESLWTWQTEQGTAFFDHYEKVRFRVEAERWCDVAPRGPSGPSGPGAGAGPRPGREGGREGRGELKADDGGKSPYGMVVSLCRMGGTVEIASSTAATLTFSGLDAAGGPWAGAVVG